MPSACAVLWQYSARLILQRPDMTLVIAFGGHACSAQIDFVWGAGSVYNVDMSAQSAKMSLVGTKVERLGLISSSCSNLLCSLPDRSFSNASLRSAASGVEHSQVYLPPVHLSRSPVCCVHLHS